MSEQINDFTPLRTPRIQIYDWDNWTDGQIWEVRAGLDFDCIPQSFRVRAAQVARLRGLKLEIHQEGELLQFQFSNGTPKQNHPHGDDSTKGCEVQLFKLAIAARYLGITTKQLKRLHERNKVNVAARTPGGQALFSIQDLDATKEALPALLTPPKPPKPQTQLDRIEAMVKQLLEQAE